MGLGQTPTLSDHSRPMTRVLIFLCLLNQGCARLSPGTIPPKNANIYLIRGYLDWYSNGIEQLTVDLQNKHLKAQAYREEQWGDLGDAIAKTPPHPLILIGFSYGADDVILIARQLNDRHLPIDLLITIDPVTPAKIPANVKRCVNFYEPNGFWDIFPWLRGVSLTTEPGATVENINIRARPDLNEPGTSHSTIAGNEKIHRSIVTMILSLPCRR